MMSLEQEKQARIGRQAMNVEIMECRFLQADSEGKPIEGTEYSKMAIYNLEKLSRKEADEILRSGMQNQDPRVIMAWPEEVANVFPHSGESEDNFKAYWKSCSYKNDDTHCECSACGFSVENYLAVEFGIDSTEYTGVKYRFCPNCGSVMHHKP